MIEAIITDLDGTLVNTYEANLRAYQKVFEEIGLSLSDSKYKECFGLRFDQFMTAMGIDDKETTNRIKELKKQYYPNFFNYLKPNTALIELIRSFKSKGGRTALASTARKENLMNVLNFLDISYLFDVIYAGKDVKEGKPSPEIYNKTMVALGVSPQKTLIFEDSEVGLKAAQSSKAHFIKITL